MEIFQILGVEHAAERLHVLDDHAGDFAFVEITWPVFRQQTHGVGEALEFQPTERCTLRADRRKAVRQPDCRTRWITRQLARHRRGLQRQIPIGGDAQVSQFNRRGDDFSE